MAHNLQHSDHLDRGIGPYSHFNRLDESILAKNMKDFVITPKQEEDTIADELALSMLRSGIFNHNLDFRSHNLDIEIGLRVDVKRVTDGTGEEDLGWNLSRVLPLWLPKKVNWEVTHSNALRRGQSDLIEYSSVRKKVDDLGFTECLPGELIADLSGQIATLHAIKTAADEGRMLAFKAMLLMRQITMAYSVTGAEIITGKDSTAIPYASCTDILKASLNHTFLVDTVNMDDDQVQMLVNLASEWPFQQLCHPEQDGMNDIYSSLAVRADNAYIYSSKATGTVLQGYVETPTQCWHTMTALFNTLGILDQLYEVFRDNRGLVPFIGLGYRQEPSLDDHLVILNYGEVKSAYTVGKTLRNNNPSTYPLSKELPSSTTALVLDCLLGYLGMNNIHHVVEKLGLSNSKIYNDIDLTTGKHLSMMVDYGYHRDSKRSLLNREVLPWVRSLCTAGPFLKDVLAAYSRWLMAHSPNNPKRDIEAWTLMPLDYFAPSDCRLSSKWVTHAVQTFGGVTRDTQRTNAKRLFDMHTAATWSIALGMDEIGVPKGGVLLAADRRCADVPSGVWRMWGAMNGGYKLFSLVLTPHSVSNRVRCTGPVSTLL